MGLSPPRQYLKHRYRYMVLGYIIRIIDNVFLCASVTAVYLPFFVFGEVLTRLN
jgi:hypothetical protein